MSAEATRSTGDNDPVNALIKAVFDIPPRHELLHDHDCAACDIADEVAGMIACYWDEDGFWDQATADDGLPGDTLLTQLSRMTAHVLHRRMPGYRRPSEAIISAARREARAQRQHSEGRT